MPAVRLFRRRWQIATDVLPLFALFSVFLYILWLVYIVVAYFITVDVHHCDNSGLGRHYLATVALFFTEYILSMAVAVCIAAIGLRGTPLEASKRAIMIPFLYLQVLNWVMQLGCLGYGTYVVASMTPMYGCWASDYRRNLTRILVYLSWAMIIIFDWGRMLILYNIAPDLQRTRSWAWRIRVLSWATGSKDLIQRLKSNENHPLDSLTAIYTDLMRGADLTPTDEVVALLLLAAHQRNMRRRHIKRKLAGKSCCRDQRNLQLPGPRQPHDQRQQQQQRQSALVKHVQNGHLEANQAQDMEQDGQKQCSRSSSELQQHSTATSLQNHSHAPGSDSSKSSCSAQQAAPEAQAVANGCYADLQPAALQQQEGPDEGQQQGGEKQRVCSRHLQDINDSAHSQGHQQQPTTSTHQHGSEQQSSKAGKQNKRPKLKQMHVPTGVDVEQGWGAGNDAEGSDVDYDADDDQVSVFSEQNRGCGFPCVITPSSMAADLAPNLTHQEAANLYLGQREAVEQDVLDAAAKFAKYAIAAYGEFGLKFKDEHGHQLGSAKTAMGKRFHSYKRNKLVRSKLKTHKQRMQYEAIIQVAQIQDEDLLYLNFSNAAIGNVPYIICLDRPTQSLVLSIRGTQSLADAATDLLAHPHPLHQWLPPCNKQGEKDGLYGHAGMLGAAAAVWEDLHCNHILAALLNLPTEEECSARLDDTKLDSRMSLGERERHMEWESSSASAGTAEGQAAKGHGHKDDRHCPSRAANSGGHLQLACGPSLGRCLDAESVEGQEGQQCEASLEQVGHEDIGQQQELRSEDQQNKFVAGIIRKGLYKDGWQLVITGHSLGAGVAALLSLKMHVRAPGLKCWAFCPPGGLLSQNLSHAAEEYCTSVIVNKDMVPRLSLKTVYRLFEGKMIALARCNKTTSRVLLHALLASSRRILLCDPRLFRPWSQVSHEAKGMLHRFQERPAQDSISTLGLEVGLYPPGKQIFLRRFKKQSQPKHAEDVSWDAVWIQPEEIIGEGIIISKHATKDHYPFSLLSALEHVTNGAVGHVKRKTF